MAEDKSTKDNRTKYLKELLMLKQEYESCYGECTGDRNLHKLSLLMALFQGYEKFEKIAQGLKKRFIIDIDRDVDYTEWSTPSYWTDTKKWSATNKLAPYSTPLTYESLGLEKINFSDKLADLMAPSKKDAKYKESQNELVGRIYDQRDNFKATINNLMNENVFNGPDLDYAIDKALIKLCNVLHDIHEVIESISPTQPLHYNKLFETLYESQLIAYAKTRGEIGEAHREWKRHCFNGKIEEDVLKERADKALIPLFQSGALDDVVPNVTKAQKAEFKKEIDFREHDIPKGMKPYDMYARLRNIYDIKNGRYIVNKVIAGKVLFSIRKKEDMVKNFLMFDFTVFIVNHDIDELKTSNRLPSKIDDIDFETLECRFSEDEVRESGISQYANGILAIIDKMKDNTQKNYWFCFYKALVDMNYFSNTISSFCNKMNKLFEVDLDYRGLNRSKDKEILKNKAINEWPEKTNSQKERKAFAMQFKRYVEAYMNYKVSQAKFN